MLHSHLFILLTTWSSLYCPILSMSNHSGKETFGLTTCLTRNITFFRTIDMDILFCLFYWLREAEKLMNWVTFVSVMCWSEHELRFLDVAHVAVKKYFYCYRWCWLRDIKCKFVSTNTEQYLPSSVKAFLGVEKTTYTYVWNIINYYYILSHLLFIPIIISHWWNDNQRNKWRGM